MGALRRRNSSSKVVPGSAIIASTKHLCTGHIVGQVQGGLHVLVGLESGELQIDLIDRVF